MDIRNIFLIILSGIDCAIKGGKQSAQKSVSSSKSKAGKIEAQSSNSNTGILKNANVNNQINFDNVNLMMFGFSNYKYLLKGVGQDFFSKYDSLSDCPQQCYERYF